MRAVLSVSTIACGGLLVLMPQIVAAVQIANTAYLLSHRPELSTSISLFPAWASDISTASTSLGAGLVAMGLAIGLRGLENRDRQTQRRF